MLPKIPGLYLLSDLGWCAWEYCGCTPSKLNKPPRDSVVPSALAIITSQPNGTLTQSQDPDPPKPTKKQNPLPLSSQSRSNPPHPSRPRNQPDRPPTKRVFHFGPHTYSDLRRTTSGTGGCGVRVGRWGYLGADGPPVRVVRVWGAWRFPSPLGFSSYCQLPEWARLGLMLDRLIWVSSFLDECHHSLPEKGKTVPPSYTSIFHPDKKPTGSKARSWRARWAQGEPDLSITSA